MAGAWARSLTFSEKKEMRGGSHPAGTSSIETKGASSALSFGGRPMNSQSMNSQQGFIRWQSVAPAALLRSSLLVACSAKSSTGSLSQDDSASRGFVRHGELAPDEVVGKWS